MHETIASRCDVPSKRGPILATTILAFLAATADKSLDKSFGRREREVVPSREELRVRTRACDDMRDARGRDATPTRHWPESRFSRAGSRLRGDACGAARGDVSNSPRPRGANLLADDDARSRRCWS